MKKYMEKFSVILWGIPTFGNQNLEEPHPCRGVAMLLFIAHGKPRTLRKKGPGYGVSLLPYVRRMLQHPLRFFWSNEKGAGHVLPVLLRSADADRAVLVEEDSLVCELKSVDEDPRKENTRDAGSPLKARSHFVAPLCKGTSEMTVTTLHVVDDPLVEIQAAGLSGSGDAATGIRNELAHGLVFLSGNGDRKQVCLR